MATISYVLCCMDVGCISLSLYIYIYIYIYVSICICIYIYISTSISIYIYIYIYLYLCLSLGPPAPCSTLRSTGPTVTPTTVPQTPREYGKFSKLILLFAA